MTIFVLFFFVYYLQWGSSFVVYKQLGNQYERLEHSMDIHNLMESSSDKSELVLDVLREKEKKITDLKETAIITVRVYPSTRRRLKEISEETGKTIARILSELVKTK